MTSLELLKSAVSTFEVVKDENIRNFLRELISKLAKEIK